MVLAERPHLALIGQPVGQAGRLHAAGSKAQPRAVAAAAPAGACCWDAATCCSALLCIGCLPLDAALGILQQRREPLLVAGAGGTRCPASALGATQCALATCTPLRPPCAPHADVGAARTWSETMGMPFTNRHTCVLALTLPCRRRGESVNAPVSTWLTAPACSRTAPTSTRSLRQCELHECTCPARRASWRAATARSPLMEMRCSPAGTGPGPAWRANSLAPPPQCRQAR